MSLLKKSAFGLLTISALLCAPAMANDYPSQPIRVIVPYAAGGPTDSYARQVANELGAALHVSVIVDNKDGASGNIGMAAAEKARPDGYTLAFISAAQAINMTLFKRPGYDLAENFTLVAVAGFLPNIILAHPSLPIKTVADLIKTAKEKPGELSFGAGGYGGSSHLSVEVLKMKAGIDMQYINYRGTGPAMNDFLGGHVPLLVSDLSGAIPYVKSGQAIALGVTSAERSRLLPDVPTIAETYPGFESVGWYALVAPRQTPPGILAKLRATASHALQTPAVKDKLDSIGAITPRLDEKQTEAFLPAQVKGWAKNLDGAGIHTTFD